MTFFSFKFLEIVFKTSCPIAFPGLKGRVEQPVVPRLRIESCFMNIPGEVGGSYKILQLFWCWEPHADAASGEPPLDASCTAHWTVFPPW